MSNSKTALFFVLLLFSHCIIAQESSLVKGRVFDNNDQPMAFCTIGILGENVGTVSTVDGFFELEISKEHEGDSLTFMYVGYKNQTIPIQQMLESDENKVLLKEDIVNLDQVIVLSSKKLKTHQFGYTKDEDTFLWLKGKTNGAEIATLLTPSKKILLNDVSIQIENKEEVSFQLLVNVYKKDPSSQLPGEQLLKKRVLVTSSQSEGWLKVDLSDQNLTLDEPFYISFKWVDIENQAPLFAMNFKSEKSYFRIAALGEWKSYFNANIKATGTVLKK